MSSPCSSIWKAREHGRKIARDADKAKIRDLEAELESWRRWWRKWRGGDSVREKVAAPLREPKYFAPASPVATPEKLPAKVDPFVESDPWAPVAPLPVAA